MLLCGPLITGGALTVASVFVPAASKLVVEKTTAPKPLPEFEGIFFGKHFSDHMLDCNWSGTEGWSAPKIVPYGNLSVSPAATALHYAVECFEGMKAYKDAEGSIRLFRPDCNIERLNQSMKRLHLPEVPEEEFMALLKELVKLDQHWIPEADGYSLYIRPTAVALDPVLGLGISNEVKLFVITCPVGP